MDELTLAAAINGRCRLEGNFTLRSGRLAGYYFDKYLFEGDPILLREVTALALALIPSDTEVLAGLELGGVPIATALSLATGLEAVFVRKQAKAYGTAKTAEGPEVKGRRVLVVEDVITTGGQVVASSEDLRRLGASVSEVLCVIDRSEGDLAALKSAGLNLRALFSISQLDAAGLASAQGS
jgi:orotate phosphoribosyltransferase